MCVVCQGAEKIEKLEKEHGWREEEFDFILQFMRTILLKHGSSLIYTTPFLASSLQSLIHSSLGIHSILKRQSLKHNVIDRDKILVPSNWDSWGKIRIIREGFDIEGVGTSWSIEIQEPPESPPPPPSASTDHTTEAAYEEVRKPEPEKDDGTSAVAIYEQTIQDPRYGVIGSRSTQFNGHKDSDNKIEVETVDTQTFLKEQLEVLEQLKAEDEKQASELRRNGTGARDSDLNSSALGMDDTGRVNEHIGPVQFNMGGIQVDADDMLRKLKEREANRVAAAAASNLPTSPDSTVGPLSSASPSAISTTGMTVTGEEKVQNQALASFFANLVKKSGGSSPRSGSTS
ncbi:hypothetical protein VTO42DRAFT_5566 [Malbranchea cinnamomea]